ncbi:hypothetical protein ACFU8W_24375 [Streptomyces sp. NPDC057565]|uniref:hypothetical protein n=1 Tax=Streptomyces sp. NPDC057565 TaxID=3346169 RepID=UPI003696A23B
MIERRLARLAGGVCVLRVGRATNPERAQRITGAVAAARAALAEGVMPGGGTALARAADVLDNGLGLTGDERTGALAVRWALAAPLHRIAANSGADDGHVAATVAWLRE